MSRTEELADEIATLVGWTPAPMRSSSDREKALSELWREWVDTLGTQSAPIDHPTLTDERITALARQWDERHPYRG